MRVVLAVAVERNDQVAAGGGKTGAQRRRLAEVSVQLNDPETGLLCRQLAQLLQGAVGAAVIDEDDLERTAERRHDGADFGEQRRDVARFIVGGDDDRQRRSGRSAHRRPKKDATPSATRSTSSWVRSGKTGRESTSR